MAATPLPTALHFRVPHFLPALLLLALAACSSGEPANQDETLAAAAAETPGKITIGTAGVTGVYYAAGGAICRLVNRNRPQRDGNCVMESTPGSIANLEALRAGEIGMAMVQSDLQYHVYQGDGPFAEPYPELRAVLSLHAEPFTVVVREGAGIAQVGDLRGKRVNIGNPGSGLVPITGPAVDHLIAEHPYYAEAVIRGGLYLGNDDPTPTFGVRATLVASASMPDEVVYLVVKSVFENLATFRQLHPALAQLDAREMARAALTAPLHTGAQRYYREAGLI